VRVNLTNDFRRNIEYKRIQNNAEEHNRTQENPRKHKRTQENVREHKIIQKNTRGRKRTQGNTREYKRTQKNTRDTREHNWEHKRSGHVKRCIARTNIKQLPVCWTFKCYNRMASRLQAKNALMRTKRKNQFLILAYV